MENEESKKMSKEGRAGLFLILNSLFFILGVSGFAASAHAGTQNAALSMPPNSLSLVSWWTFDGPTISGTTIADSSGSGNNGTAVNGPVPTAGVEGQALSFNGSTQYVQSGSMTIDARSTFSMWFKASVVGGYMWGVNFGQPGCKLVGPNGEPYCYVDSAGDAIRAGYGYTTDDGQWHLLTLVLDGSSEQLYVDGTEVVSGTYTTSSRTGTFYAGESYSNGYFNGSIDDVRIYNRALSASEVQKLYQEGRGSHITTCKFGTRTSSGQCRGYITSTSATTWTVPSDWNSSSNTIEVIGAGGGAYRWNTTTQPSGGGGGAYSKAVNVTLTTGTTVTIAVGAGGVAGAAGGDTYLCSSTSNCASIAGTAVQVGAKGGGGPSSTAGNTDNVGGAGGAAASGVGTTKYSGGAGGDSGGGSGPSGAGGGGAGGPNGNGAAGGSNNSASNWAYTGGAGGGSGGGTAGAMAVDTNGATANGGNNSLGAGGGVGAANNSSGGTGIAGGAGTVGGGGGGGQNPTFGVDNAGSGGNGGAGTEWDASHGAGGGGGGAGDCGSSSSDTKGDAGNGGLYGAGAGGGCASAGSGAQGIIVITYTPTSFLPSPITVNTTLTPPNLASGLVGHWTFDGPDMITNVTDTSGQGNNGALVTGGAATSTMVTPGVLGQALSFNGTSQYVYIAGQYNTDLPTGPATFSAWVKPTTTSGIQGIVGELSFWTLGYGYGLLINSGSIAGLAEDNGGLYVSAPIAAGAWSHVVFTLNGWGANTTGNIYVNGVLKATSTGTAGNYPYPYGIGAGLGGGGTSYFFNGIIDDVRVYNRALSAAEVKQLYNLGR